MAKECCNANEKRCPKAALHREVALLGNPNAGKTTLFNLLTGARQRTGNWPGVTVERKEGQCRLLNEDLHVVDLPGTYSLDFSDTSADERVARDFVQQNPDYLYINIVDASTLERGLYLTLQLRELNVPMIVLLNMMDVAERRGMKVDVQALSERLGCPVTPISLRQDKDLHPVHHAICHYIPSTSAIHFDIPYHNSVEQALLKVQTDDINRADALFALQTCKSEPNIAALHQQIEAETHEEFDFLLADARFDLATRIARDATHERGKISRTLSDKLDRWVLGSWTGIPIFLVMMYLLFLFSINLGGAFIDFFDMAVQTLAVDGVRHVLSGFSAPEWLITLLADGLGGGLQVVATFIPIIAALYLFLTLLEESGYMARAAFVMDQFMRRLGVSGKAFVPLIVGFGCNVPSIMATRTLDTQQERIITVLMAPFMSCGARLAVYALFAAAFFQSGGQNIVFLLYLIGIAFAILTGLIMRKTLLQGGADHFVMEMPTYQLPGLRNILINTWNKLRGFIVGAGKLIVAVVVVINVINSLGTDGSFGNQNTEKSVLSATAKAITPVFAPMGIEQDNWPATVGIVSGLLAKEVVVGTLDALYSKMGTTPEAAAVEAAAPYSLSHGLQEAFATIPTNLGDAVSNLSDPLGFGAVNDEQDVSNATFSAMNQYFDGKIGAFAYLLFILMYFPCVAATGAMYREVGARWASLGVAWSTGLGYGAAILFYQLATFTRHPLESVLWAIIVVGSFMAAVYAFYLAGGKQHDVGGNPRLPATAR